MQNPMQIEVPYGEHQFVVSVEYGRRRRLSITVHPDLRIIARVPLGCKEASLRKLLGEKVSWISKQITFFEQFHPLPPEKKFITGEIHYYLGRQYTLRVEQGRKAKVRLIDGYFEILLPHLEAENKAEKLMHAWYRAHAKEFLEERFDLHLPRFLELGAREPDLYYRRMKRRWGSCSQKGHIVLNTELIKTPIDCIDYVIIHELCHLLCGKHDKKFFDLLGKMLPDWERRKKTLEKFAHI